MKTLRKCPRDVHGNSTGCSLCLKRPVSLSAMLALMSTVSSCQQATEVDHQPLGLQPIAATHAQRPIIQISTVPTANLGPFDESRMFHYRYAEVDPDSVMMGLWLAGVPVVRGLLPMDNMCMDPVGPRFTIEVEKTDAPVAKFDSLPGSGRLMCATKVREYRMVAR